jgi:hypothetical protein
VDSGVMQGGLAVYAETAKRLANLQHILSTTDPNLGLKTERNRNV